MASLEYRHLAAWLLLDQLVGGENSSRPRADDQNVVHHIVTLRR